MDGRCREQSLPREQACERFGHMDVLVACLEPII